MRYPAEEKLEIIKLVEQSNIPAKQALDRLGIPRSTFYLWYNKYALGGIDALEDKAPMPARVWNRIPDNIREKILDLALEQPELSPRELAVRFTDTERYFVSEASVYRLLKAHDLITSPAFIVIKADNEFKDKTKIPNEMWQTDFTYLKVIGWGWFYLSTILDDYSRYIIAWKLCTTMKATDVTDTLELALQASGCDQVNVRHRPRLLSDNGASYIATELAEWLDDKGMDHVRGAPYHPQTQGKIERWHQTLKNRILLENYFLPGDLFILFCDDLSFDKDDSHYKSLKAVLDGGIEGRPDNVVLYATSNRRHLMPRDMIENERQSAVNPTEAVEEKVSLSDRFGLWLGFHACNQDDFLAMIRKYCDAHNIPITDENLRAEAIEWSQTRGGRSGRVAWQYVTDLAGRRGISLS